MSIDKLTGYRTLIVAAFGLLIAVLAMFGIVIPQDTQAAILGSVTALLMAFMRLQTTTPVGKPPDPAVGAQPRE